MAHQLSPGTAMKLTYRGIAYDKNPTATVASSPMILGYRGVPYLKNRDVVQTIEKQVAVTYRGQEHHITHSLASLPTEGHSLSF
ncbi:hypothetical protein NIES3806_23200 [Microcystis aeruginosa NIES-3806]|uniref:DUF4278 domain-containing protein n=2 Tax=Microcystis aeruginosa TaxID=1126 RepID=A0AAD3G7T4_MICAE|nr:hypothetical protein NIES3806_23200 [Microcystis aeruginosa NIES-3806]GCL57996.1 hypothetical protein NIES3807_11590 [Microcystis aeruginosa NIES-3807]